MARTLRAMTLGLPRDPTAAGAVGGVLGAYRLTGVLGRGGMGVVYRGQHLETGRLAAIKTVHAASPDLVAGIRREIQALASVSHEGLVSVLAYGISEGLPWYAMELLVGQTLGHLIAESGAEAQSRSTRRSTRLLTIVRRMCGALSHLHSAGIVHCDLKPDNVFVRSNGDPILVDLGIASRFSGESGREALDAYVGRAGTLHYMAPEQISGEFLDARADLYALGCILYECVTGAPPFSGMPPGAVKRAHLEQRPSSVASIVEGISPSVDRLIAKLLEKEPQQRLGYADDVARILQEQEDEPPERSPPTSSRGPSSSAPYVYRPPFVGRRATLDALSGAIQSLRDRSRGGAIYIGGESGVGKTRLTMEATRRASECGLPVVIGQCTSVASVRDPQAKGLPLHAFGSTLLAIADHCREHGAAEVARIFGSNGRVLAGYQPALADLPGFSELPEPPALEALAARERVLSTLQAALLAFAASRPQLLVIDDLQWADELSLEVLARLPLDPTNRTGFLVICTYRPEECGPRVEEIVALPGVLHVPLGRFGLGEVSALVRGMLALDESPMPLASALERKCNGNPFFIIEYLRSAIAQGLLRRDGGRWQLGPGRDLFDFLEESVAVPAGVGLLVEQRLRDLDPEAQRLVEIGAVLGRQFSPDLLFSCARVSEPVQSTALRRLRDRQIFEDSAGGTVRFVHDVIRETAYLRIPDDRSRSLHQRAAVTIESSGAVAGPDFRTLAYHLAKARLHERSAAYYRRAGGYAESVFANDEAIASYQNALAEHEATGKCPRAVASVHEALGDLLRITGRQESARESYGAALERRSRGIQRARLHRKIGKTWETHHVHDRALESYALAASALGEGRAKRDEAFWQEYVQLTLDRLWVHYWLNRVEEMEALIASSRDSLMEHGSPFQRARFVQLVVMLRIRRERYLVTEETVALAREAFELGAELAEADRAALHFVVFFALVLAGALDAAETEGATVLAWATRAGAVMLQARCLTYLMVVARRKGQLARVKALAIECEAACAHARLAEYTGTLHANRAWAAVREDRRSEARTEAEAALAAWRTVRVPYPMQWMAIFPLLALAVDAGQLDGAATLAQLLFAPEQQRLPEELSRALRDATSPDEFDHALELAKQLKYL
ncbi:hypothetical protein BH11MYX4_BH11MYX4_06460 [soil metagenome]